MEGAAASPPEDIVAAMEIKAEVTGTETALDDALDMIALEMAAPDFAEPDAAEPYAADPSSDEPVITAQATGPAIPPQSMSEPSLGASLIANGIVRRPDMAAADPLTPIRRMSQAEKIAFFS
jgi:hypothetical protein